MSRYERWMLASRGVGRSVFKRAGSVALVLVVLQLLTLQLSVNGQAERLVREAARRAQETAQSRDKALARALAESKKQQQQTQAYVRCLIGIVLQPLADRPDDVEQALDECGSQSDGNQPSPSNNAAVVTPTPSTSTNNQPTTSAPPDPGNGHASPTNHANPLVDIRPLLNGAYQTIKSVPLVGGLL